MSSPLLVTCEERFPSIFISTAGAPKLCAQQTTHPTIGAAALFRESEYEMHDLLQADWPRRADSSLKRLSLTPGATSAAVTANCRSKLMMLFGMVLLLSASTAKAHNKPSSSDSVRAVSDLDIKISGTLQPRISYGMSHAATDTTLERFGYGLRRARLRVTASIASNVGVHYDVDFSSGNLSSVDLYAFYRPNDNLRLRAGYLAGPQPRSYIPTSHTRIDAIDRAAIGELWSRRTIGSSGRDFGVEAQYKSSSARFRLFLHAGDGSFDRMRGNFRQSISSAKATGDVQQKHLALSLSGIATPATMPGLEFGAFASYNGSRNPNTFARESELGRRYASFAGHIYYGADPGSRSMRLKAEALLINYEERRTAELTVDAQRVFGASLLGAIALADAAELFARYERFWDDIETAGNHFLTGGLSFSPSAAKGHDFRQERLTLAYALAQPADGAAEHTVVLQAQFVF